MCPLVGGMPIPPIRYGELAWGKLTAMSQSPGVVLSLPVRIICLGAWRTPALLCAASVMTYVVKDVAILCGDAPQDEILSSI